MDVGFNFWFNSKRFMLKEKADQEYKTFDNAMSKYFGVSFDLRIFLFQIKSKQI